MKQRRIMTILGAVAIGMMTTNGHAVTLKRCALAYAWVHIIDDPATMATVGEKLIRITTNSVGEVVVEMDTLIYTNDCLDDELQESTDLTDPLAWQASTLTPVTVIPRASNIPYFDTLYVYTYILPLTQSNMFYRTQYTSHALDHFTEAEILQKVSDLGIVLPLTLPDALASNETITIYSNSVVDQIFHIQSTTTFTNETFNPPGEYFGHYTYSLNWYNAAAFSESTLAVDYPAFTNSTTYTLDWNSTTGGVLSATGDENISTNAGWTFLYTGH